jgi:peroxiredoxin (alkyl hydroperoxide reductase subunit C)
MTMLQVSRPAPDFSGQALVGRDFKPISLQQYRGKWVVLVFYPLDFTFVCPTELVGLNDKHPAFESKNAVVIAASTDSVYSHLGWVKADARLSDLKYPILGDITKQTARSYGVLLEEEGVALRGTFVIDPEGVLRFMSVNDLNTGRNIDEILRVLDALQTGEMCPCDWRPGQATLGG